MYLVWTVTLNNFKSVNYQCLFFPLAKPYIMTTFLLGWRSRIDRGGGHQAKKIIQNKPQMEDIFKPNKIMWRFFCSKQRFFEDITGGRKIS